MFCLKLKFEHFLEFFKNMYIGVVLSYFPDLLCSSLEAKGEVTLLVYILHVLNSAVRIAYEIITFQFTKILNYVKVPSPKIVISHTWTKKKLLKGLIIMIAGQLLSLPSAVSLPYP